jgi:hypothetical protein
MLYGCHNAEIFGELVLNLVSRLCMYLGGGNLIFFRGATQSKCYILCSSHTTHCISRFHGEHEYLFGPELVGWSTCKKVIYLEKEN